MIRSILDATDIDYYFKGENFQMVYIFVEPARLMVKEDQAERAWKLLKDLDFTFSGFPAAGEE